jgi:hypothetical protein
LGINKDFIVKNGLQVGEDVVVAGNITANNIIGQLQGNSETASTLETPRTITIGSTGKTFDGSSNVSWALSEIGVGTLGEQNANNAVITGGSINGTTIGGASAGAGTFTTATATTGNITTVNATTVDTTNIEVTNLKAKDGTAAGSIADSTGVVTIASSVLTTTDINGGTIDGATIATSDITVGTGKTLNVSSGTLTLDNDQISGDKVEGGTINAITINTLGSTTGNITTVNATTVDSTNVEVTNIKAKDGTASATIADSTGVMTIASSVLTTADINGGTIDGVTIGGASAGAGTFTTLTATGNVTLGDAATDTVTITADVASNLIPSADNTYNLGASGSEWKDLYIDGTANIDSLVADTADINGGSIDGVTIGTNSAVTEAQIDNININGNAITSTNTDGNIALTPNGTGEVDISKVDIDGGTIDGATIGGSTPAAISGTTGQFGTSLNVDGTITSDGLTVEAATDPTIRLFNTGNVTSGEILGTLEFYQEDGSAPGAGVVASIEARNTDAASGAGSLAFTAGYSDSNNDRMLINSNGDISFYEDTGTTPKFFWDASAEALGIGTSSPAGKLHIIDSAIFRDATDYVANTYEAVFTETITGGSGTYPFNANGHLVIQPRTSTGQARDIVFATGSNTPSTRMVIASSGNVGIGTSSPVAKNHIRGSGTSGQVTASWMLENASSGTAGMDITGAAGSSRWRFLRGGGPSTGTDTLSEAMCILTEGASAGNVGIGTSSPSHPLTVQASGTSGNAIKILGDSTNDAGRILWRNNADSASTAEIEVNSSQNMIFKAGAGTPERLRIDSSGNVGIGTSSPVHRLTVNGSATVIGDSTLTGTFAGLTTRYISGSNSAFLQSVDVSSGVVQGGKELSLDASQLLFRTISGAAFSERARIDASGNLLVGKTAFGIAAQGFQTAAAGQSAFTADAGQVALYINHVSPSGTQTAVEFRYGASTTVGNITLTSTATTYATSSDYRLKEDVQPMVGASDRLMALKPVNFAWKVNGSRVDGFIAHEAQEVVPEAVTGEKDGEEMQAIDHSKLVPLLTAALQEALTKIEALEARLNALEGQ